MMSRLILISMIFCGAAYGLPPPDTTCTETCRTINPNRCRVVNARKLNNQDWYIADFSNPEKPLNILHFCMGDSLDALAALYWLKANNITEQCALRSFSNPLLYYYRSQGKSPVTRCRPNGYVENHVMGRIVYADPDPLCDTLPQMPFSKADISVYYRNGGVFHRVDVLGGVLSQEWRQEELKRFYCLVEKYRWNRMGVFYQYYTRSAPDTPFFMRYEPDEE